MKNKYWYLFATAVLLAGAFTFWYNQAEDQKISFETAPVQRGDLEMIISASGTLNATNTVEVGTQVSGVIEKISADFNDRVEKGQEIARIDTRNLRANLEQAKAAVTQAEVQLAQRKRAYDFSKKYNSTEGKDLSVVEAEATLEQVRAQKELAEQNYNRFLELFEGGVVSQAELDAKRTDFERLKANFSSANAMLNRTKANVSNVDVQKSFEDYKSAKANLASAKANLEKAKINFDYAIIRAPISGVVISRNIEVGQTVAASFQTPVLFTIADDLTKMEIEASIDEADIGFIKVGQPVSFSVDAYLDDSFSGKVEQIRLQPKVISNVVTYTVIINAQNNDLKLMPGMTATLDVIAAQRKNVFHVPVTALNFMPPPEFSDPWQEFLNETPVAVMTSDKSWKIGVLWKSEDGQLIPKKVRTGLNDGTFTEIESKDFREEDAVVIGINKKDDKKTGGTNLIMPSRPGQKKK